MAASLMLAGGTLCFAQAQQPAVRDTLPQGQGQAVDQAGASDRPKASPAAAAQAQPDGVTAAAPAVQQHGAMAMGGQQVDQQLQQQMQKIQQQKDNMTGDRLFVLNAALHNQYEMSLAQLAQQKSQDQNVKQLAQRIMQDHQQATQQLQQVAQKLQVDLPQGLPSLKQQELQVIGGLESKMFDQKFVCKMDELHAHDVAAFRNASQIVQSPDLKQFTTQTLPKLQQHHQLVKQSAAQLGLSADADAQPAGSRIQGTTPGSSGDTTTPRRTTTDSPRSTDTPPSVTPQNRPDAGRPPAGNNAPGSTGGPSSANDANSPSKAPQ